MISIIVALLANTVLWTASAHDVPYDVRVQAFLKPSGKTLQLLVRVPLAAMQEVDFARRGPGYLDIARADEALQFAGSHLVTSLLSFNVGVELGQLLVLVVLIPLLNLVFRFVPERMGAIILSALVAHTAWHWLTERRERQAKFLWPGFEAADVAGAMRWVMAFLILCLAVWWVNSKLAADKK